MEKLIRADLLSLEQYAEQRQQFRANVMTHKKNRQVHLGEHATLIFEDRLTVQYQIQEMLRIEKIFESAAIEDELEAYNPLIPDGTNLKATFLIEYEDAAERQRMLSRLLGIEDQTWMQVAGFERVYAIADEDMERERENKTSSVHFLRFEFSAEMIQVAHEGAALSIGIDHGEYKTSIDMLTDATRTALLADFS